MRMDSKPEMLILSGLPASGKSTYAKLWVAEDPDARLRMCWDDFRLEMYGPDWKFNGSDEAKMIKHSRNVTIRALNAGISVIIDNTNLTPRTRNSWVQLGRELGVTVTEHEIDTPIKDCVYRDRQRTGRARVGRAVIERMALFHGFIDWKDYHTNTTGNKDFVLVDVDGTIADPEWRRDLVRGETQHKSECPIISTLKDAVWAFKDGHCIHCGAKKFKKDWRRFFADVDKDPPIQPIINLVKTLKAYDIIVVSGRPIDPCGKPTEDWLLKHGLDPLFLFMRDGRDSREDTVVKKEIALLLPLDRVAYVIDDRPSVLRMWQSLGLTTLAVGDLKEF